MSSKSTASPPLAHSPRPKRSIPVQTYADHICRVIDGAVGRAASVARFSPLWGGFLRSVVHDSAEYHDLGKLDSNNQAVLRQESRSPLPLKHEDAGVAHFLDGDEPNPQNFIAAMLIHSHHKELPCIAEELARDDLLLRFSQPGDGDEPTWQRTKVHLASYRAIHSEVVPPRPLAESVTDTATFPPLPCRIALSCLVDADHSDTARHYQQAPSVVAPEPRWPDRLAALDAYVAELSLGKKDERTLLRKAVYDACRLADPTPSLWECDSPVGTGKTTAIMAHLLHAAAEKDKEKPLRRLFVVLPYTNIIDQSVDVYRRCLTLPGEDPESVVAAVHHKAEYQNPDSRHLAALWNAPIVVTTAVSFFETLAASSTVGLRKLHSLVGSGVFIDESHAALPAKLWPQAWDWIKQLAEEWGCHFVLGSGSLNRIWTIPEIDPNSRDLPSLVHDQTIRTSVNAAEKERVKICTQADPLTPKELVKWLNNLPGPRLLIVNTVQIAAVLADMLIKKRGPNAVLHLSTSLTPHHRSLMLQRIKSRLAYQTDTNWTLVATSCIEAGVDVSFRTGLRQQASLASLFQTTGRVNRNGEFGQESEVWNFQLIPEGLINVHRDLEISADILGKLLEKGLVSPDDCARLCTSALKDEIIQTRRAELNKDLRKAESSFNFPEVQKLFRVIDAETYTAVVSKSLQERIEKNQPIDWRELQQHSVQIYKNRAEWLQLRASTSLQDVFFWDLPYDDLLGYMAGVLPLLNIQDGDSFII